MNRRLAAFALLALGWLAGACGGSDAADRPGLGSAGTPLPVPTREAVAGRTVRLLLIPFAPTPALGETAADRIVRFIDAHSGLRLEVLNLGDYVATAEALARGEGDAALLSPLLYVQVVDRFASDPALQGVHLRLLATAVAGGSPTYVGYITAAADSSVRELSDVASWPFGMVAGSTSAYLYPIDLADFRGLDPARLFGRVRFYPNHADMVADLLRPAGERPIEAGALYQYLVDALTPAARAKLRVIAKTARIPRDAIVMRVPLVGGREDPRVLEVAGALQHALLEMDHDRETARALRDGIGYDGWILGEDRRYDAVRKMNQRFGHYRFGGPEVEGAEGRARNE